MNEERSFTISPDTRYWEIDKPILFAGEWCLDPYKKDIWSKLDYKILESNTFYTEENLNQIKICDRIYEKLLSELSAKLNELNNINWSLRSWRIVVGPWLERYVAVINNRLNLLKKSKVDFNIKFKSIKFNDESLASFDLLDFTDKANSHEWNENLIRRLNEIYTNKDFDSKFLEKIKLKKDNFNKKNLIQSIIKKTKIKFNLFWKLFPLSRNNSFLLHRIYIGDFFLSLKLF